MSRKILSLHTLLVAGLVCAAPAADALNYEYKGVNFSLDTKLAEGLAVRAENRDAMLIGIANGGRAYSVNADDGDLNFRPGSIVEANSSITSALKISYDDYGIFTRLNYIFDPRLNDKNYADPRDFGAGHQYPDSVRQATNHLTQDHIGSDGTILDLYAFANFDIHGHSMTLRAGRQTVNWGETTLILNGLNSIVALDANKARYPGAELETIFIPAAQVFASANVIENVSVEGWYQLKWERTIADSHGSYFETNDFTAPDSIAANIDAGRAGEYAVAGSQCTDTNTGVVTSCVPFGGSTPRGSDRTAKNSGQFGVAVRVSVPVLNDLELAFYGTNYHSRLPVFSTISAASGNPDSLTTRVFAEYPESIHMYGMSFNSSLPGGFSLQGEYSYRPNQPLEIDDAEQTLADVGAPSQLDPVPGATLGNQYIRGWRRKAVSMWDVGTTKILGPNTFFHYDDFTLVADAALIHVHNLEAESVLRYEGPGTFLPGDARGALISQLVRSNGSPIVQSGGFATSTSAGYRVLMRATYNNVLPSLALKPTLVFSHDLLGVTPAPLYNFVRGSRELVPIMGFQYRSNTTAELGYNYYFGGGQGNLVRDRDYAFFDIKYEF